ncbi:DNA cross-link repair protein SNM1-like protein [Corchorus olitorius]|uniref:DNA cross-link repair protein SNM1-like protein n=1 Tax=Corchorus olitorius TaxID=93759 RepID=A0A1R3IQQ6_9ROSI|nr:DNA cross-link repair protein SNM1-like protein [Corchorus olitorius]
MGILPMPYALSVVVVAEMFSTTIMPSFLWFSDRKKVHTPPGGQHISGKGHSDFGPRRVQKSHMKDRKLKDIPIWCSGAAFQERHLEWMLSDIFKEIVPIGFSHTSIWTIIKV